jgi:hypothetical protein
MKITTRSFVEHQSSAKQDVRYETPQEVQLLAPGAGCSCWGHSSCSCCSWGGTVSSIGHRVGSENTARR